MKSKVLTRGAVALIIFGVLCVLAACLAPSQGPQEPAWFSIIPPLLAIVLAFLTRHVLVSLGVAILAGGLLTQVPQAPLSAAAWLEGFKTTGIHVARTIGDRGNLEILVFIPLIFVMIEILIASGGFRGIIVWLLRWVKGGKSAQLATALMGVLCFIDDYTSAIIVGSMMQPITDRFRVSRQKLAFIVDATSTPIAGLAVISTWIAYEVGLLGQVAAEIGIDKNGYSLFFDALSFRFYCWLMIAFVFSHIIMGRDFGPMKDAEKRAGCSASIELRASSIEKGRAINALVPLAGLILFHVTGLWLDGGGPAGLREGGSLVSLAY